jgi:hypothetical protein
LHRTSLSPTERAPEPLGKPSPNLLARLEAAHDELLSCIGLMEHITNAPLPDVEQLTGARFKISRASRAHRAIWHEIWAHLQTNVEPRVGETLRELTGLDCKLSAQSSEHVSRWPLQTVLADWQSYQLASLTIRRELTDNIERERCLLYPLLHA